MKTKKITWICAECGLKHGRIKTIASTFHNGKCDVCGKRKAITEGRDFGVYEVKK